MSKAVLKKDINININNIKIKKTFIKNSKKWNILFNYFNQCYSLDENILMFFSNDIKNNKAIIKSDLVNETNPILFFQKYNELLINFYINKQTKSLFGKKYNKFYSYNLYSYLKNNFSYVIMDELKTLIKNNYHKYNSDVDILCDLFHFKHTYSHWNINYYLKKIDKDDIVYNNNNEIIFKVNSFNDLIKFSSCSWCINDISEYYVYIQEGVDQFIKYNFNLPYNDKCSVIGITKDSYLINSFDKNNDEIKIDNKYIKYL